jgi:hypothetical protein
MAHTYYKRTWVRLTCPQTGVLIHTRRRLIHTCVPRELVVHIVGVPALIRVQQLAKRPDIPSEIVVLGHLALDLLAAVQHGRMVAPSKRLAYP